MPIDMSLINNSRWPWQSAGPLNAMSCVDIQNDKCWQILSTSMRWQLDKNFCCMQFIDVPVKQEWTSAVFRGFLLLLSMPGVLDDAFKVSFWRKHLEDEPAHPHLWSASLDLVLQDWPLTDIPPSRSHPPRSSKAALCWGLSGLSWPDTFIIWFPSRRLCHHHSSGPSGPQHCCGMAVLPFECTFWV